MQYARGAGVNSSLHAPHRHELHPTTFVQLARYASALDITLIGNIDRENNITRLCLLYGQLFVSYDYDCIKIWSSTVISGHVQLF